MTIRSRGPDHQDSRAPPRPPRGVTCSSPLISRIAPDLRQQPVQQPEVPAGDPDDRRDALGVGQQVLGQRHPGRPPARQQRADLRRPQRAELMDEPDPRVQLRRTAPAGVPAPACRSAPGRSRRRRRWRAAAPGPVILSRSTSSIRSRSVGSRTPRSRSARSRMASEIRRLGPPETLRMARRASRDRRGSGLAPRSSLSLRRGDPRLRLRADGLAGPARASSRAAGRCRPRSAAGSSRPSRCRGRTRCPARHRTGSRRGRHTGRSTSTRSQSA